MRMTTRSILLLAAAGGLAAPALGQGPDHFSLHASHVIVPQRTSWAWDAARAPVVIEAVEARVSILEQVASTTLEIHLRNPGPTQAEAVLLLPVPDGAAVGGFDFQGSAMEPTARLLPRDEARRYYDDIVRRLKDPGLLEWAGYRLIRSSVFPVPPGGTQTVKLTYEHLCPADGDRIDYVLPRSESLEAQVPWKVEVELRSERPISMVYSPSHDLVTQVVEARRQVLTMHERCMRDPGSFRLSILRERGDLTASLIAYPDPEVGGGYFLLMAGLPGDLGGTAPSLRREVTLVIDRSGSMAGAKLDQVKAAALQVIEGLDEGEAFNLIDYSSQVASFAPRPVPKDRAAVVAARAYLSALRPIGGTNIHDALVEALRQEPTPGTLPLVLFLTDGLPTVGNTSEVAIRQVVEQANPHRRRVFTFGVGDDVNVPLLDRISDVTRATGAYVVPGEDVEVKVAQVFRRLSGPVLADLRLTTRADATGVTTRAIRELMPVHLPDLFEGEPLVLLGQYTSHMGNTPIEFELSGNFRGTPRSFRFRFDLSKASTRNAFVPRLWATRKIAFLVDQIRQAGASPENLSAPRPNLFEDPRYKELAEEILRLSTRFGVLSEYTAFLATEGTDLGGWEEMAAANLRNLDSLAVQLRSGRSAVSQGRNFNDRKVRSKLDYHNGFWAASGERVQVASVQQIADRAFYKRGTQWVDGGAAVAKRLAVDSTVTFGSEEHLELVYALAAQGRQGLMSLGGEILLNHEGQNVLVIND
jgi:Ca-activated chloride channel family protein